MPDPQPPLSVVMSRFLADQDGLYAYIRAAGFRGSDADDLLQDLATALITSQQSYDEALPFSAWARGVLRHLMLKRWRDRRIHVRMHVDSDLCLALADTVAKAEDAERDQLDEEKIRLEQCLERLEPRQRKLLSRRYADGVSLEILARELGRSYQALNMVLTRLRRKLLDCVSQGTI